MKDLRCMAPTGQPLDAEFVDAITCRTCHARLGHVVPEDGTVFVRAREFQASFRGDGGLVEGDDPGPARLTMRCACGQWNTFRIEPSRWTWNDSR